ncbi:hypothetical protein [Telluribacter sp.]|jgi:hypothetical protein|uniref:hypothetical protein n=1 Tax=Telluribacter sp. TaxID=1978767 RepID=UPI002E1439AC|nr:hypothetical protein [Telluribacter sp.]
MYPYFHLLLSLIVLAGFPPTSCAPQSDIKSLLLTESTRGLQRSISVSPARTLVVINEDSSQTSTSPATWEALVKRVLAVPPDKVPQLRSGGTRHQVDAALQSQLTVETSAGTFSSPSFDHNRPPAELTDLHQALYKLIPEGMKDRF